MSGLRAKQERGALEIHTEIITGRCRLENITLHSGSISGLVSDEQYLSRIPYCEVMNLTAETRRIIGGIFISMEFDLVFLYEYHNFEKNGGLYNTYSERIRKTFVLDKKDFSDFHDFSDSGRCLCLVRNTRCELDCAGLSALEIEVFSDIECLILEEGTVEVEDSCVRPAEAAGCGAMAAVPSGSRLPEYVEGISLYIGEIAESLNKLDQRMNKCEITLVKQPEEGK